MSKLRPKKLKIFFYDNWGKMTVILSIMLLLFLTIFGLSKLDSFYRTLTVATLPMQILIGGLHAMVFVGAYLYFMRGGFGKFKKNKIKASDINVKFSDVIGLEGAKKEAMEVVQLIKDSVRVKKIGGKVVKGIMLMGHPGCGKTLLAKAIATEAKMPFLSMSGSEFVEVFVGVGASRVRQLFQQARKLAYAEGACIVFIDEIEVIGRGRTFSYMGGGEETNSTQNQLLVEMDGLESNKNNIIVIGATNANESVLDKALLRPGRFDRKIYITLPNLKEREALFDFYLKKVKAASNVDISKLARKAVGKSPAEIENIIKEAALFATRENKDTIDMSDISSAMDRIDLGLESHIIMTPKEREMTAYHEAGHAVTLYYLHPTDDVFKATIKSRGDALGLVAHNPKEEWHTQNKDKLIADIMVALAGYSSEKIKYGTTSTGVSSDFTKAMAIANAMVWRFGMGEKGYIGDFTAIPKENMSTNLKEKLNSQTMAILDLCLEKVDKYLIEQWDIVDKMAQALLEKEELDYDDIAELFAKYGKNRVRIIDTKIASKNIKTKETVDA